MSATELSDGFSVDVDPDRDGVVVRPRGELDLATAPALHRQLQELCDAGWRRLVVDFGGLTFIDSSGIHLALTWAGRAAQDGIDIRFVSGSPVIQLAFDVTGVRDLFVWTEPRQWSDA